MAALHQRAGLGDLVSSCLGLSPPTSLLFFHPVWPVSAPGPLSLWDPLHGMLSPHGPPGLSSTVTSSERAPLTDREWHPHLSHHRSVPSPGHTAPPWAAGDSGGPSSSSISRAQPRLSDSTRVALFSPAAQPSPGVLGLRHPWLGGPVGTSAREPEAKES